MSSITRKGDKDVTHCSNTCAREEHEPDVYANNIPNI